MINKHVQGTGIGKRIMEELFSFLAKEDFKYVRLGCIKENIEGMNFWRKHQFQGTGFEDKGENYTVVGMDRTL